jgi:large subunit ribosomal protein L6
MEETIELPEGIQASIQGSKISLKSPKGENSKELKALGVKIMVEGSKIKISSEKNSKKEKKAMNSMKAHLKNLINGLEKEYSYKLAIVYAHFPINVSKKENRIEIVNFLGSKKPKSARIIGKAQVEIKGKEITVHGSNREEVGQTAANIEQLTRLSGKDRRIFQDGIFITIKE